MTVVSKKVDTLEADLYEETECTDEVAREIRRDYETKARVQ